MRSSPIGPHRLVRTLASCRGVARRELIEICRAGYRGVELGQPVTASASAAEKTDLVVFLREALGVGLRVLWEGAALERGLVTEHLDPPRVGGVYAWTPSRSPRLSVRFGPDFAIVNDRRLPASCSSLLAGELASAARLLEAPREVCNVDEEKLKVLVAMGMVFQSGEMAVLVAPRVRFGRP